MNGQRVKLSFREGDEPANQILDLAWGREHESELFAHYGDGYALVFHKRVVGFGPTIEAAIENAESRLLPESDPITPACVRLFDRQKSLLFATVRKAKAG